MRVGLGYDIHRLIPDRKLILGGIVIPYKLGEEAYSDGDVLTHAIIDALLGAAGLDDIGEHFPPGEAEWKDISSLTLLKKTVSLIHAAGYSIVNIDCTVIIEKPKITPYKNEIRKKLSEVTGIEIKDISVKAKTKEGIGETGAGKAVEAYSAALLKVKNESRTDREQNRTHR